MAAELIEMPFGLRTRAGPRNYALDWVHIPMGRGNFMVSIIISKVNMWTSL